MDVYTSDAVQEVLSERKIPLELIDKILTFIPPEPNINNNIKTVEIKESFFISKILNVSF